MKWQQATPKFSKMKDRELSFCIVERRAPDNTKPKDLDGSSEEASGEFQESKRLEIWSFSWDRNSRCCTGGINGPRALRIPEVRAADLLRLSVLVSQSEVKLQHIDELFPE